MVQGFWKRVEDIITPSDVVAFVALAYIALLIPVKFAFGSSINALDIVIDTTISIFLLSDWAMFKHKHAEGPSSAFSAPKVTTLMSISPILLLAPMVSFLNGPFLTILPAMKLFYFVTLINRIKLRMHNKIVPRRFKFIAAAYITVISLNTLACGWLVVYPPVDDSVTAYIKGMYWLITTIATVGYGDITPSSNLGRVYAMFIMVTGAAIWGVLIASASRLMLASDRRKEMKKEKMESLQSFFSHYTIPKPVQMQVVGFYNHLLNQKMNDDERAVLSELPAALQAELQTYMNLKLVSKVNLFKNVSSQCLAQASRKLEQSFYSPGDQIIVKGDYGTEMFLIGHGTVQIHDGETFIANLSEGHAFGEFALLGDGLRSTDVTAVTYCDVFKLSKEKFDSLIKEHADLRLNIERLMSTRRQNINSNIHKKAG
ncbi:MAG: cyclic nucleotide-binding domain-containing protein [Proteobacteria bacterium]|nr:cyclic nucleotide-binding domain-containing protein [Pseudomonadota bacterium]